MKYQKGSQWVGPESNEWAKFFEELSHVNSTPAALALLRHQPLRGRPGRRYYANFSLFMHRREAPDGSSAAELTQYLRIIRKLGKEMGVSRPGARGIERALMSAILERYAAAVKNGADVGDMIAKAAPV